MYLTYLSTLQYVEGNASTTNSIIFYYIKTCNFLKFYLALLLVNKKTISNNDESN